jgi:TfoX/Sxy family transcriptional regulator of competence genes
MKWHKPSKKIIETYERIIPDIPLVERRKMFGYPCGFVNRNMFLGTFEESVFIRLSEPDRQEFLNLSQAKKFEPIPGRIMKEYVIVPPWLLEKKEELNRWIQKSLDYVSSLPPKIKKKKQK